MTFKKSEVCVLKVKICMACQIMHMHNCIVQTVCVVYGVSEWRVCAVSLRNCHLTWLIFL